MKIHIHHSNLEMVFLPENTLCLILVCCLQRRLQRSISMVIMMIMFCWQKIESTTEHTQEGLCLSSLVLSLLLSTELAAAETIPWVSAIFPNKQGKIQPSPSIYALLFLFLLSFFTRPSLLSLGLSSAFSHPYISATKTVLSALCFHNFENRNSMFRTDVPWNGILDSLLFLFSQFRKPIFVFLCFCILFISSWWRTSTLIIVLQDWSLIPKPHLQFCPRMQKSSIHKPTLNTFLVLQTTKQPKILSISKFC